MKTWTSVITYSVLDMGRECETKEEYIELVKDYFREEHNLEILENEISHLLPRNILLLYYSSSVSCLVSFCSFICLIILINKSSNSST